MAVSGSLPPLLPSHVCRSNLYKFQFSPVQSTTTTTNNKIILQNRNVAFWPGPNARGWIRKMQPCCTDRSLKAEDGSGLKPKQLRLWNHKQQTVQSLPAWYTEKETYRVAWRWQQVLNKKLNWGWMTCRPAHACLSEIGRVSLAWVLLLSSCTDYNITTPLNTKHLKMFSLK